MNEETQTAALAASERRGATSASSAQADYLCEGRHQAQRSIPEPPTSSDAGFGIAIHEALATGDASKLTTEQLSVYESCAAIREKLISDTFGPDASKAVRFIEQRYWCMVGNQWEHSAKPDLVVRSGSDALIIEYKCLPGAVEDSPSNLQLRDQAILVSGSLVLTKVTVAIIQPLVTHSPTLCQYDASTLKQAAQEMFARVIKSNTPNAKRTAGDAQCKFCLARHTCPERAAFVAASVPSVAAYFATVPVKEWTPEQRSAFCERVGIITKWIDECKAEMKALLTKDPESIPGFELEPGSVRSKVVNPDILHQRFLSIGGTTDQFMLCVDIGKKDLEAVVRSVSQLKGKGLKAKIDELLEGIVESKQTAPSIERKK